VSRLDHKFEPEVTEVCRLEVITGTGRRRHFSEDFKAQVVEETLGPGAVVSDVARRHGLRPQQVFTWRRQARRAGLPSTETIARKFVPAVVATAMASRPAGKRQRQRPQQVAEGIEVEIAGVTVRIGRGADAKTIAAVLQALRAGA
jgi:transposase